MRLRYLVMVGAGLLALGGIIWVSGSFVGKHAVGAGGVPLIKADTTPVKITLKEEQGDEIIPNADSTVFEAMGQERLAPDPSMKYVTAPSAQDMQEKPLDFAGFKTGFTIPKAAPRKVESLFDVSDTPKLEPKKPEVVAVKAEPEPVPVQEPVPAPAPVEAETKEVEEPVVVKVEDVKKEDVKVEETVEAVEDIAVQESAVSVMVRPVSKPKFEKPVVSAKEAAPAVPKEPTKKDVAEKTPVPKPMAKKEAPPKPVPPKVKTPEKLANTEGGYYIQVGSSAASMDSKKIWTKLQGRYPQVLNGLTPSVQTIDIPGKGSFARIQAGPMSKDDADTRCARLRAQNPNGGCIVVKR
jgi:cell division septation protein DedD